MTTSKYDVILNNSGRDEISVALALVQSLQNQVPHFKVDVEVHQARRWLGYVPLMLRRGVPRKAALALQARYRALGAEVSIRPTRLLFPDDCQQMTPWRKEWYSEHLLALQEEALPQWAQTTGSDEAYRFSILPSVGADMCVRFWRRGLRYHGIARSSIGHIGPTPGPPKQTHRWGLPSKDWLQLKALLMQHRFWESASWNTVPDDLMVLDGVQWIFEGWRAGRYHVLVDETPNAGAAKEVGLGILALLPQAFQPPQTY